MKICKTKRGMYGKNHTDEAKRKISKANKGKKNGEWKGDDVGNNALHNWVRRNKPKPDLCESCHKAHPRDLHNTTGTYKRNLEDWIYLCRRCHMQEDKRLEELIKGNKGRMGKSPSDETREKLSIAKSGKNNPMYGKVSAMKGKHHTEESKRKMSIALKELYSTGKSIGARNEESAQTKQWSNH